MKTSIQNDLTKKYSKGIIAIHWLTTLLIVILFPLGKYMEDIEPEEKMNLIKIHALLGIVVLVLTLARCWIYFKAVRPAHLKTGSAFNDKLAIWTHNLFYFLLLEITVSGIGIMISGGYYEALQQGTANAIKAPNEITPLKGHGIMATILMLLFVIHVIGVIKHYVVTKEYTLKRII